MRSIKSKKSSATRPNCLTDSGMMAEDFCFNSSFFQFFMPQEPSSRQYHDAPRASSQVASLTRPHPPSLAGLKHRLSPCCLICHLRPKTLPLQQQYLATLVIASYHLSGRFVKSGLITAQLRPHHRLAPSSQKKTPQPKNSPLLSSCKSAAYPAWRRILQEIISQFDQGLVPAYIALLRKGR